MKIAGTLLNSTVLLASAVVTIGGASNAYKGFKSKNGLVITLGVLTALVGTYALMEAQRKLNA